MSDTKDCIHVVVLTEQRNALVVLLERVASRVGERNALTQEANAMVNYYDAALSDIKGETDDGFSCHYCALSHADPETWGYPEWSLGSNATALEWGKE